MIVADTSIWIEYLKGNREISFRFTGLLEEFRILGVSFIFGELLQGVKNKREKEIVLGYWSAIKKIDEYEVWIEAGEYANEYKLLSKGVGLIDAAIVCAAKRAKAKIWTLDTKVLNILEESEMYK